jgi:hypothetical protein
VSEVSVTVYLNEGPNMLWKYETGDKLELVLAFETDMPVVDRSVETLLEIIWEQLNFRGDLPRAPWARRYFGWSEDGSTRDMAKTHRSLSMGDVVTLGETAWSPISMGWTRVHLPALEGLGTLDFEIPGAAD